MHANEVTVNVTGDGSGTVTSAPAGINCKTGSTTGCSYVFPDGTNVSLTATTSAGSTFAGWSGACSSSAYSTTCAIAANPNGTTVGVSFSGWSAHSPFPLSITSVALLGSTYIAVGSGNGDATSADGVTWTGHEDVPTINALTVVANTAWGASNAGNVVTSSDGIAWTTAATGAMSGSGGAADLDGIAYGNGTLVAVGTGGAIVYSTDLIAWHSASSGTMSNLASVTFANGLFVAVGAAGTILTSTDGITWTVRTSNVTAPLNGVAFGGATFVAVGGSGTVLTSSDAMVWTQQTRVMPFAFYSVAASNSLFVAVGESSGGTTAFTSPDGVTWTSRTIDNTGGPVTAVAYAGGAFYAMTSIGSIARSSDGVSWTDVLPYHYALFDVAYNGSIYVAVGWWGSIFSSPDGVTWTCRRARDASDDLHSVIWAGSLATPLFVAAGGGMIMTSPDGITWTGRATVTPASLAGVAFSGSVLAAVGYGSSGGVAITSTDGINWNGSSAALNQITSYVNAITYGNGQFVASGNGIYTSSDGASWTRQTIPDDGVLGSMFNSIAYGNGVFVAVDTTAAVAHPPSSVTLTSTDGINWTNHSISFPSGMLGGAVVFGNGVFLTSGLATSTDGVNWTTPPPLPNVQLINGGIFTGATYAQNRWLAVGQAESFLMHR